MDPKTALYIALMLAAGMGVPILAAMNARVGSLIGSAPVASVVMLGVAFLGALAVMLLTSGAAGYERLAETPKGLLTGGLLMTFYLASITWVAPRFGIGNAILCVLLGQMLSSSLISHFGLFGAVQKALTFQRLGGLALMAAGLLAAMRA